MPGVAVRTAAVLLVTVGDGTSFHSAAHLASYAGLAPATKSSGISIHGEHASRGGNRQLKRAMFLSAFAALHDPASRTYYDKCRARGKTLTQALLRLARHRISVLFAMLRDGTFYEPRPPASLDERHRGTPVGGRRTAVPTPASSRCLWRRISPWRSGLWAWEACALRRRGDVHKTPRGGGPSASTGCGMPEFCAALECLVELFEAQCGRVQLASHQSRQYPGERLLVVE